MSEILYGLSSQLIAGFLLAAMTVAIEVGYRIGWAKEACTKETTKDHVKAIQTSLLGILALLLAFSFSLSLQRFDSRNEAVVDEANAIGTTFLRAHLLPSAVRNDALKLLKSYTELRVQAGAISLDQEADRKVLLVKASHVLEALWDCARRAAGEDPNPVTTGLFIQSLNETIDAYGRRDAVLRRHVPEVVLYLLIGTFIITGGVLGYTAGVTGHRPALVSYILVVLIVALTFIIVDLDRPRRGLIKVDQRSLYDLKSTMDKALSDSAQLPVPAGGASHRR
jgi:hypothetical protein